MAEKAIKYLITFQYDKAVLQKVEGDLGKLENVNRKVGLSFAKLAERALLVVPVWMTLRTVMLQVTSAVSQGAQRLVELDKGLRRAQMITRGVDDMGAAMRNLSNMVEELASKTGRGVGEITEAFYQFGTVGFDFDDSVAGMNVSLMTSIGLMGDTTETSKTLAQTMKNMGDAFDGTLTFQEKLVFSAGLISSAYEDQAFELSEISEGMKAFASVSNIMDIKFTDFVALLATSNTLMQKGSTAGTQLSRSFQMMLKNLDLTAAALGTTESALKGQNPFDIYISLIQKLGSELKGSGSTVDAAQKLNEIFGTKGIRVTGAYVKEMDLLISKIKEYRGLSQDEALRKLNEHFELQNESLEATVNRLKQVKSLLGVKFLEGLTSDFTDLSALFYKIDENSHVIPKMIEQLERLTDTLKTLSTVVVLLAKTIGAPVQFGEVIGTFAAALDDIATGAVQRISGQTAAQNFYDAYSIKLKSLFAAKIISENELNQAMANIGVIGDKYSNKAENLLPFGLESSFTDVLEEIDREIGELEKKASGWIAKYFGKDKEIFEKQLNELKEYKKFLIETDEIYKKSALKGLLSGLKVEKNTDLNNLFGSAEGVSEINLLYADRLALFDTMSAKGYSQLEIERMKYEWIQKQKTGTGEIFTDLEKTEALQRQAGKIIKEQTDEYIKQANVLKSTFSGGLAEILRGEGDFTDLFHEIGETAKKAITDAFAENITDEIFKATGIGDAFGGVVTGIKSGGDYIKQKEIEGFIEGGKIAANYISGAMSGQGTSGAEGIASAAGGLGGLLGGFSSKQLIGGSGGYLKPGEEGPMTKAQARAQGMGLGSSPLGSLVGGGGLSAGQALGAAGGIMGLASLPSYKGTGNAMGGAMSGAMAGMMVGGPIGAVLGGAAGFAFGAMSKTTEEISETTKQINAQITISNKNLEIVNRNLVALRTEISYILPDSAYFREGVNIEDQFSLSARR